MANQQDAIYQKMANGNVRVWNGSHGSSLLKNMYDMYLRQEQLDAVLACGNENVRLHNLVLVATTAFRGDQGQQQGQQPKQGRRQSCAKSSVVVALPERFSASTVRLVVRYMYLGDAEVPAPSMQEFFEVGKYLKVIGLMHQAAYAAAAEFDTVGRSQPSNASATAAAASAMWASAQRLEALGRAHARSDPAHKEDSLRTLRPSAPGQSPARMRRMLGASQSQTGDQSDDDDDSSEAELKIDEGEDAQNVFQGHWQPNGSGIYIHPANGANNDLTGSSGHSGSLSPEEERERMRRLITAATTVGQANYTERQPLNLSIREMVPLPAVVVTPPNTARSRGVESVGALRQSQSTAPPSSAGPPGCRSRSRDRSRSPLAPRYVTAESAASSAGGISSTSRAIFTTTPSGKSVLRATNTTGDPNNPVHANFAWKNQADGRTVITRKKSAVNSNEQDVLGYSALNNDGSPMMNKRTHRQMVHCALCHKLLKDPSSLYRHNRLHRGVMTAQCPVCSKLFSQSFNMRQHLQTHRYADVPRAVYLYMAENEKSRLKNNPYYAATRRRGRRTSAASSSSSSADSAAESLQALSTSSEPSSDSAEGAGASSASAARASSASGPAVPTAPVFSATSVSVPTTSASRQASGRGAPAATYGRPVGATSRYSFSSSRPSITLASGPSTSVPKQGTTGAATGRMLVLPKPQQSRRGQRPTLSSISEPLKEIELKPSPSLAHGFSPHTPPFQRTEQEKWMANVLLALSQQPVSAHTPDEDMETSDEENDEGSAAAFGEKKETMKKFLNLKNK